MNYQGTGVGVIGSAMAWCGTIIATIVDVREAFAIAASCGSILVSAATIFYLVRKNHK